MPYSKPTKVIIGKKEYPINTDYRYALKCDEITRDETISDYERALALVYTLFGEKGLNSNYHNELLEQGMKYLVRNSEGSDREPDMDYKQDWGYIKSSFMSDYKIAIDDVKMHYYDFVDYLNGLTEHSMLSRVRYIRGYDTSGLKGKELTEWNDLKKSVALKKEKTLTKEQEESVERLMELIGG